MIETAIAWLMTIAWKTDFLPWLPSVFTLLGWYVINRQNNQRESRKDLRAAADRSKVLAREIAQLGFKYWAGQDETKAWQIKATLEELEVEIGRFPQVKRCSSLMDRYVDFVDAVTGYDFESTNFYKKAEDHPVFQKISLTRQKLLAEIENQFKNLYP